jgi:hypothetical protein
MPHACLIKVWVYWVVDHKQTSTNTDKSVQNTHTKSLLTHHVVSMFLMILKSYKTWTENGLCRRQQYNGPLGKYERHVSVLHMRHWNTETECNTVYTARRIMSTWQYNVFPFIPWSNSTTGVNFKQETTRHISIPSLQGVFCCLKVWGKFCILKQRFSRPFPVWSA